MENVIITNQEKFEQAKRQIQKDGSLALHILADFDRTLTKMFVNGKKRWSLLGVLRDSDIMPQQYKQKAQELFDYYHPLETDSSLTCQEKKNLMEEWWNKAFGLMIDFNFSKDHLQKIVDIGEVEFRGKADYFFEFLNRAKIPLVIMSACGVGEAIKLIFAKNNFLFDNIFIISNSFKWSEQGLAIEPNQPIIHSLNKDKTLIKDFPEIFDKVKNRKNIILLGDNPEDIGMALGFDYENIIKVGFLNEKTEQNLENYKKAFDAVILKDGNMDFINNLLKEIVS